MKLEMFCSLLFKSAALKKKQTKKKPKRKGKGPGERRCPTGPRGRVGCPSLGQIFSPGQCLVKAEGPQATALWWGPTSTSSHSPASNSTALAEGRRSLASLPCACFDPTEHPTVSPSPTPGPSWCWGQRGWRGAFIKWAARSCQWSECAPWLSCAARRCWSSSGPPPPAGTCPQRWCHTGRAWGPWAAYPVPLVEGC